MNLAEFKAQKGVAKLAFYKSNSKGSTRHVAVDENRTFMLVTTSDFDPKGEKYIYKASAEQQAESELELYWLSNTKQAEAAFEL